MGDEHRFLASTFMVPHTVPTEGSDVLLRGLNFPTYWPSTYVETSSESGALCILGP